MANEKRLISLDMACSMLNRFFCNAPTHAEKSAILEVKQALLEMATTEVVHGRWERVDDDLFRCSACDDWKVIKNDWYFYCPNCGADMRERKNEERNEERNAVD